MIIKKQKKKIKGGSINHINTGKEKHHPDLPKNQVARNNAFHFK